MLKTQTATNFDPNNENIDLCQRCADAYFIDDTEEALRQAGHIPHDIPDQWIELDAEHPDYDDDEYECAECHRPLTMNDN